MPVERSGIGLPKANALILYPKVPRILTVTPSLRKLRLPPPQGDFSTEAKLFAMRTYGNLLYGILDEIAEKLGRVDTILETAFLFAVDQHAETYRKSGLPYIIHPLEAAKIGVDAACRDVVVEAVMMLHDVVEEAEDKELVKEKIKGAFGEELARLVDGLSRYEKDIGKLEERDSLEKAIRFSQEDVRVILGKSCDRLHNMRTLQYQPEGKKRLEIAQETFDIFAPLANILGFRVLYRELQDLSLAFLFPEEFKRVSADLEQLKERTAEQRAEIIEKISAALSGEERNEDRTLDPPIKSYQIVFTPRYPFEIFEQEKFRNVLEVRPSDIFSFLVLVENTSDTDRVMGRIHRMPDFTYLEKTFVDLIGHPSPNGYEAKHTQLSGPFGVMRIQTTTVKKHHRNEFGPVANSGLDPNWYTLPPKILSEWLAHLKSKQVPFKTFRRALHAAGKQIVTFAVRPGKEVKKPREITIPYGATAWDLAYAVHIDIGLHAMSCMINGRPAALSQVLENFDRVSIYFDARRKPSIEDLQHLHTLYAADKLMRHLEKNEGVDALQLARAAFYRALREPADLFLEPSDFEREEVHRLTRLWLVRVKNRFKGVNVTGSIATGEGLLTSFYRAVGQEDVAVGQAVDLFREMYFHNSQRMVLARTKITRDTPPSEKAKIEKERARGYGFRIRADVPDEPGVIATISEAISKLGLNITTQSASGNELELEIEVTWAIHEIQIKRIFAEKIPGCEESIRTRVHRKPAKVL